MSLWKRILLPTDFSPASRFALNYACELAAQHAAELHLLHVLQNLIVTMPAADYPLPLPAFDAEQLWASAEQALARLPDPAWEQHNRVIRTLRPGSPFVEIVRYAREQEIDLIVIGTHGRTGLTHVLLGSVAENVVRKAHCPVLTVRPPNHAFVFP